jgi:hypothetical protein
MRGGQREGLRLDSHISAIEEAGQTGFDAEVSATQELSGGA